MSLAAKIAAAQAAEQGCEAWRARIVDSRAQLGEEFRRTATPVRIVVSGLALGFAVGLKPKADGQPSLAGKFLGGPVFSMVLEAVLPGLLAGLTAAAGLQAGEEVEAPDEEQDAGDLAEEDAARDGQAQAS
ncbi:hypothetical protein [Arenimonas caeni]|uniref:Protein sip-5 n=1 Tax=Arenimonas caeni TaxID=2058085 RepID=A0A2P6MA51_9GAMM|nr:hypothetical protein [Arenimonas caeni]PRH82874.1 hypothetical protein C6N40_04295 [Arenimonas caeni]